MPVPQWVATKHPFLENSDRETGSRKSDAWVKLPLIIDYNRACEVLKRAHVTRNAMQCLDLLPSHGAPVPMRRARRSGS